MNAVLYEKDEAIAVITLDLDGRGPTPDQERQFMEAVSDFSRDPSIKVGILTGTGSSFCGEWTDPEPMVAEARLGFSQFSRTYPFSASTEKPVIAAVNSQAAGRGFELALDCDVRLASQEAAFSLGASEDGRRLIYFAQVLPRLVPFGEAMRLLLSADELLTAPDARRIGLVQDVFAADRLMPEALALARSMAKHTLPGLKATKKIGLFWRNLMLGHSYELARTLMER